MWHKNELHVIVGKKIDIVTDRDSAHIQLFELLHVAQDHLFVIRILVYGIAIQTDLREAAWISQTLDIFKTEKKKNTRTKSIISKDIINQGLNVCLPARECRTGKWQLSRDLKHKTSDEKLKNGQLCNKLFS